MKKADKNKMTGKELFEYYQKLNTNYASIVKMLPGAAGSFDEAYNILERGQKENKRIIAYYPGIDSFSTETMEPIGPIIDGYMFLYSTEKPLTI